MMRPSQKSRVWRDYDDEPSPRELREMRERGELFDDEDDYDEPGRKAPLILRLVAWISLIMIFFAVGYGATSMVFKWMDSQGGPRSPENLSTTQRETERYLEEARSADIEKEAQSGQSVTLSIPEGSKFVSRTIQCGGLIREDTIGEAVSAYMDALKESSMMDASAQSLNLFESGDMLYLNMNSKFLDSLNKLGSTPSRFVITGLVRTVANNFKPINKIKFYIDGREASSKKAIDLSMAWGI